MVNSSSFDDSKLSFKGAKGRGYARRTIKHSFWPIDLTFEQILWCILFHVCLLAATSYMFISLEHRYPDYMQHFRDSGSGVQTSSSRGIIIIMYILAVIVIFLKGVWKVCKVL